LRPAQKQSLGPRRKGEMTKRKDTEKKKKKMAPASRDGGVMTNGALYQTPGRKRGNPKIYQSRRPEEGK